ncbi:MAG: OPT/YSL family transporter [Phycisphaerae bacterium]|jgi:uncharacterized oligopeptide transporter (OPT) family protein|nr:OPT/YSL family transporter [Phycisphaerae bacterium]
MALPHLSDDEIRTWTREQKDRWWLENVFRGDMAQLTLRAGVTGFLLGGILSATNLYVGAKTGWSLGVGVTSVILAFLAFRILGTFGIGRDFTILENNAVQSVATAAGYMTAPLISSLLAFMMMTNAVLPWWQMLIWMIAASILGVLVAFPMKRRFVNDEQLPFPEGRACAVVLDSLYPDAPPGGTKNTKVEVKSAAAKSAGVAMGMLKAKALGLAALLVTVIDFLKLEGYQTLIQKKWLGMEKVFHLPDSLNALYYKHIDPATGWIPKIAGIDIRQLAITPTLELSMFGAGGLMGRRIANSLLIGCVANYFFIAPWMINAGEILPKSGSLEAGDAVFGRGHLLNTWCLWWGIAIMVTASLTSLFAKPKVLISAFSGMFTFNKSKAEDCLKHIELPLKVSFIGIPIMTAFLVWMHYEWFGINPLYGFLCVPLIIVLTLIAANATGLTSTTPTGSLSKITQFTFGAIDRTNPATNLITAGLTSEVASNASNLLMDIKPGYMLGAKPRQQAWGHLIGIFAGGLAAVPLFFWLFLPHYNPALPIEGQVVSEKFPMPGALIWKGVADMIAQGGGNLRDSAIMAMIIAGVVGIVFEVLRVVSKGKFPISAVAIGLGVVIPVDSTIMMWIGAMFFSFMHDRNTKSEGMGKAIWVESQEAICAGIIAGAALTGIGDQIITNFFLG